jgi:fluoroacetyl-CoA thioesterase
LQLNNGLKGLLTHEVVESDLATNWRNTVPVLATPILLWLAELACMRAIEGALEPGKMTLGYGHDVRHLAATPCHWVVHVSGELVDVTPKMLTFEITAHDGRETVLMGRHMRAIVDRERFVARVQSKADCAAALPH